MKNVENVSLGGLKKRVEVARKRISIILEDDYFLDVNKDIENTILYFLEIDLNLFTSKLEVLMILNEILDFAKEWSLISEEKIYRLKVQD